MWYSMDHVDWITYTCSAFVGCSARPFDDIDKTKENYLTQDASTCNSAPVSTHEHNGRSKKNHLRHNLNDKCISGSIKLTQTPHTSIVVREKNEWWKYGDSAYWMRPILRAAAHCVAFKWKQNRSIFSPFVAKLPLKVHVINMYGSRPLLSSRALLSVSFVCEDNVVQIILLLLLYSTPNTAYLPSALWACEIDFVCLHWIVVFPIYFSHWREMNTYHRTCFHCAEIKRCAKHTKRIGHGFDAPATHRRFRISKHVIIMRTYLFVLRFLGQVFFRVADDECTRCRTRHYCCETQFSMDSQTHMRKVAIVAPCVPVRMRGKRQVSIFFVHRFFGSHLLRMDPDHHHWGQPFFSFSNHKSSILNFIAIKLNFKINSQQHWTIFILFWSVSRRQLAYKKASWEVKKKNKKQFEFMLFYWTRQEEVYLYLRRY